VITTALVVLYAFVTRTVIGRQIYAVGGNAKAAKLSGIKTERLAFLTFVNMACWRRLPASSLPRGSTRRRRRPASVSNSTSLPPASSGEPPPNANPMSDGDLEAKLRSAAAGWDPRYDVAPLVDAIWALDKSADVSRLASLTVPLT
jgi:branched-subunit amino acid transport system permease